MAGMRLRQTESHTGGGQTVRDREGDAAAGAEKTPQVVKALSSEKCREGRSWEPRLAGTRVTAHVQEGECPGGSECGGVSGPSLPGVHGKAGETGTPGDTPSGRRRHRETWSIMSPWKDTRRRSDSAVWKAWLSYRCPSTCSPKFTLRPNPIQSSTLNDPQPTSENKEHKVGCAARSTWLKERGAVGMWEGVVAKGERGASTRETGDWAHSLVMAHLGGADMWRERLLLRLTTSWHCPGCKLQTLSKALPGTSCWNLRAGRSHEAAQSGTQAGT